MKNISQNLLARPRQRSACWPWLARIPAYAADAVDGRAAGAGSPDGRAPAQHAGPAPMPVSRSATASRATPTSTTFGNEIDTDGFVGGGFAGYNYQVGNIVAGVEADVGYSWRRRLERRHHSSKSGLEGSLRARLGYVVSPTVLLYATAGGAAKDLEVSGGGVERQQHHARLDGRRRRRRHGDREGLRPCRVSLHRLRQRHVQHGRRPRRGRATPAIASPSASA